MLLRLDSLLSEGEAKYDFDNVTIEHVLPQTPDPDSEWCRLFPDPAFRLEVVHTLGNLELLTWRKNSAAQNYDFQTKKAKYFTGKGKGSALGAHLPALLATDASYLLAEKLALSDVAGVVAISGGYRILPIRKDVFGDEAAMTAASPFSHLTGGHPPFLILYGDGDTPEWHELSKEFRDALKKPGGDAEVLEVKDRTHQELFTKIGDATAEVALAFIPKRAAKVAQQFVLFDATLTFTKEDADNSKPSKSQYYVTGKMLSADRLKDWTSPVVELVEVPNAFAAGETSSPAA